VNQQTRRGMAFRSMTAGGCRLAATQGWQPVLGARHRHSLV
jgi:hypothetical protein